MAEAERNTGGRDLAWASARARFAVPGMRLSRSRAFLRAVQRPTMLSPARWITASKPETAAGAMGCAGSQRMRSSSLVPATVETRARRAIRAPVPFREIIRADPIRPDEPLTRMRNMARLPTGFQSSRVAWPGLFPVLGRAKFRARRKSDQRLACDVAACPAAPRRKNRYNKRKAPSRHPDRKLLFAAI